MSFGDEISRMTHNHLMSSVVIIGLSFFFFIFRTFITHVNLTTSNYHVLP